jgi:hypothetical protein
MVGVVLPLNSGEMLVNLHPIPQCSDEFFTADFTN